MNRIHTLFQTKQNGILSVYFTAGYPNLNDTTTILRELQQKGIHLVEIGIPFSDPMADGPVIQQSSTMALRNGMSLRLLFDQHLAAVLIDDDCRRRLDCQMGRIIIQGHVANRLARRN